MLWSFVVLLICSVAMVVLMCLVLQLYKANMISARVATIEMSIAIAILTFDLLITAIAS